MPRKKRIIGQRVGGEPKADCEHFIKCPACGDTLDMRDLGAVLAHEERCKVPTCYRCHDVGWVCESHPERPWSDDKPNGCTCDAGEPCPDCNRSDGEENQPRTGRAIANVDAVRGKGRVH